MNRSSDHRDLERELSDWLHAAAPSPAPDLADRLLRRTAATPQRRRWSGWSFMVPALGGAALAVVVLFVGLQLWKLGPEPIAPLATPPPGVETPTVLVETPAPSEPDPSLVLRSPSPVVPSPPPPETSPSPSAEVFPNGQTCTNDQFGYTVSYPAGWWANPEVPLSGRQIPVPACIYFEPDPDFTHRPGDVLPVEPTIAFERVKDGPASFEQIVVLSSEERTVDGHPATVRETRQTVDLYYPAGSRTYEYFIELDDGDFLVVETTSGFVGDREYARNREVVDRMMQTLRFDSPSPVVPSPSPVVPSPSPVVPSPPPETTPPPTEPSPSPSPGGFPNGQSCYNDSIGYTVSYPAGWWAQEELPATDVKSRVPACIAFAPTETDIIRRSNGESVPAIYFQVQRDTRLLGDVLRREETTVDGRPAMVREIRATEGMFYPSGTLTYQYLIELDDGRTLVVDTDSVREGGDYARDVKVIDKMMQTLRFDP